MEARTSNDMFCPSPVNYQNGPIPSMEAQIVAGRRPTIRQGQNHLWQQLDSIFTEIQRWQFVREYNDLSSIIWDLWMYHQGEGSLEKFEEHLSQAVTDGEMYIQRLTEMLSGRLMDDMLMVDLSQWSVEISLMYSQVHRAIAWSSIRLDMVRTGLMDQYPDILHPGRLSR